MLPRYLMPYETPSSVTIPEPIINGCQLFVLISVLLAMLASSMSRIGLKVTPLDLHRMLILWNCNENSKIQLYSLGQGCSYAKCSVRDVALLASSLVITLVITLAILTTLAALVAISVVHSVVYPQGMTPSTCESLIPRGHVMFT